MNYFKLTMLGTLLAASLLSACGGGGDSTPAASATATVSGTAATGAAIAGGTVSMTCVSGASATTNTAADGSYSLNASGIVFPCVARVSYGSANKLHSYVSAAGTANITPVTELVLAKLTSGTGLDAFDKFDASKAKLITGTQLAAAIAAIKAELAARGIAVTDFPADPVATKFIAKTAAVAGDKADAVLDALAAYFKASGKTLGDVVSDVAKRGGTTTSSGGTTTTAAATPTAPAPTASGGSCSGDTLAFFTKNKGSYPVVADLYTPGSLGAAATVAGIKDKGATTVVVSDNCTVTVGTTVFAYKANSYSPSTGGQVDVELTGAGFRASYEVFGGSGSNVNVYDETTKAFANFMTK